MTAVHNAFESFAPAVLTSVFARVDYHEGVSRLWVEVLLADGRSQSVYEVGEGRYLSADVDEVLGLVDADAEAVLAEDIAAVAGRFRADVEAAGVEVPSRIVLRYETAEEAMESAWDYTAVEGESQWAATLVATGDDGMDGDDEEPIFDASDELSDLVDIFVHGGLTAAFELVGDHDVDVVWLASSFAPLAVRTAYGVDGRVLLASEIPAHVGLDPRAADRHYAELTRLGEELVAAARELGEELPPGFSVVYSVEGKDANSAIMEEIESGDPAELIDKWLKSHDTIF